MMIINRIMMILLNNSLKLIWLCYSMDGIKKMLSVSVTILVMLSIAPLALDVMEDSFKILEKNLSMREGRLPGGKKMEQIESLSPRQFLYFNQKTSSYIYRQDFGKWNQYSESTTFQIVIMTEIIILNIISPVANVRCISSNRVQNQK